MSAPQAAFWGQPGAGRRPARAPPRRRRARRIGRAVGRPARGPPHRGRRHRPPPAAARPGYDEVIAVPEAEAFETARRAAHAEGIFSGPSTGANIAAALAIAGRLGTGHRVVTMQVDSGLKYLAGQLYS
jgi:threonine synthase